MCFIEKRNCILIRKIEDRVSDPVCTLGRVGSGWVESGTGARALSHLVVSKPSHRRGG